MTVLPTSAVPETVNELPVKLAALTYLVVPTVTTPEAVKLDGAFGTWNEAVPSGL